MPWFPDFVAAAELARNVMRAAGQADPVAQYLMALTKGDAYALEATWPGHIVVLDPYAGEVRGHRHLQHFVRTSHAFLAERLVDVEWVASTSVGGRAVVELLAHLKLEGEPVTWPVAVVAEATDDRSVTFRTYGSQWPVVGHRPIRASILDADPSAEPGDVVMRYLTALDAGDRDGVVQTFTTDGYLQEPIGPHAVHRGTEELSLYFSRCFSAGGGIGLDRCCVTDDGVRCALEYNCVRWGSRPLPAQAGLAVFERDAGELLTAARYYDDVEAPVGHDRVEQLHR
jgi:ketosteroid isomerase-like protein